MLAGAFFMLAGIFLSSGGQTFEAAMQLTCDAAQAHQNKEQSLRLKYAFRDLEPRVTNQEVIELWMELAVRSGEEQVVLLDAAAKRAGIARCKIRDEFVAQAAQTKRSSAVASAAQAALVAVEWQRAALHEEVE